MAEGPHAALSSREVEQRIRRLEELLARVEQLPGVMGELALDTVAAVTDLYGAALARVMDRVAGSPELVASLVDDELVRHLLVLHGIHPQPVEQRVAGAVAEIREDVRAHGGDVELIGVTDGVARLRLEGSCNGCSSSRSSLEGAVREAVLAVAPELSGVEMAGGGEQTRPAAFIPLKMLSPPVPR
jgi:Fe-S cluster biogenesis protein NfuA